MCFMVIEGSLGKVDVLSGRVRMVMWCFPVARRDVRM